MEAVESSDIPLPKIAEPARKLAASPEQVECVTNGWPHLTKLYAYSEASKFKLTFADFSRMLQEVSEAYLPADASPAQCAEFCHRLRLKELAMARACAQGSQPAWEYFLSHYRQKLYKAADVMTKDTTGARELADSVCSDLFGVRESDEGCRLSKFQSYTGRGSLDGWLRAVVAQEHINRRRSERSFVSFEEGLTPSQFAHSQPFQSDDFAGATAADARLEKAIAEALHGVTAEEQLILVSYYLDGRKLAEIARMLGLHESTISRRLDKITASLRKTIFRSLRKQGMSARASEEAMRTDVCRLSLDVRKCLSMKTQQRGHLTQANQICNITGGAGNES